jgi:hypothetical protein
MDNVDCAGDETTIWSCPFVGWNTLHNCGHHEDAGVSCSSRSTVEDGDIRLVNGVTRFQGRLEIYHKGEWGTVCDDRFDLVDAEVACLQLGFSGALSVQRSAYYGRGSGPVLMDEVQCSGNEQQLSECHFNGWRVEDCIHQEDVGIKCVLTTDPYTEYLHYGRVRLVGGSTANEGRVEIYYSDEWGTVCDDDWDMQDADVVCHQLGYPGASGYRTSATFGKGSGMVWIENVHCSGQETSLVRCGFNGWGSDCDHSSDAGVVCFTSLSPGDIRLDGSTTGYEGRVEIYYSNQWGSVCNDNWDRISVDVVCQQLGYDKADDNWKGTEYFGQGVSSSPVWLDDVSCSSRESRLEHCDFPGWGIHNCDHSEDAGVVCQNTEITGLG